MSTLKEIRTIYKMSVQDVADAINVSKQLISKIELGQRKMSAKTLDALSNYFKLDEDVILKDTLTYKDKYKIQENILNAEEEKFKQLKLNEESLDVNEQLESCMMQNNNISTLEEKMISDATSELINTAVDFLRETLETKIKETSDYNSNKIKELLDKYDKEHNYLDSLERKIKAGEIDANSVLDEINATKAKVNKHYNYNAAMKITTKEIIVMTMLFTNKLKNLDISKVVDMKEFFEDIVQTLK